MVETTRRKAVASIGGLMLISGCSDILGSDDDGDENGANGANGLDESDADDENGVSDDEPDPDEVAADDAENETAEDDTENETAANDTEDETDAELSTEEFVTQLETVYSGEVGDYDEDDTHGFLTLIAEEDTSTLELASDMDGILAVYSSYVESNNAPSQQLEGEVETTDGSQEVSEFAVETEWVEAYNRGELSEEELQDRVLETVEA
ncbi:hypothetical protein [Natronococcus sp. A-GB7]|uniref:hypothetical protein n=1 Tax=Natronococcus sp. A-GB7 TaxID=3037649 RepID=UPI00241DA7A9|nr:hypothetical protein [Natronococcus sp. A-GB7]MDG5821310.1 hypothetical protein [Natronococcus sp. A-GB7]